MVWQVVIPWSCPDFTDTPLSGFFSFKGDWAISAQFRVKSFAIVMHFNVFEHLIFGIGSGFEPFVMHCFDLEAVGLAFPCR